jgi:nitrite reductase (NADH) large subunit
VERVGIERLRAVLVENSDKLVETLDAALQRSLDAVYDPWQEAIKPRTANQFASVLVAAEGAK